MAKKTVKKAVKKAAKPKKVKARADEYMDKRETRSPAARLKAQLAALRSLVAHAKRPARITAIC